MPRALRASFGGSRRGSWPHIGGSRVGDAPPLRVVSCSGADRFGGSGRRRGPPPPERRAGRGPLGAADARLAPSPPLAARMRRRLFWQIYAAFLLVAVLSVGATGLATRLLVNRALGATDAGRAAAALIFDGLPDPEADPQGFGRALAGRARALGLHLSLWTAEGRPLGRVGDRLPAPPAGCARPFVRAPSGAPGLCLRLPDGRWAAAAAEPAAARALLLRGGGLLVAVFGAVAVGCYPLARGVTARLEALRDGVAAFGAGQLGRRVPVRGRDEVAQLAVAFNASAAQVEALVGAQRRVLAHASHELRSPLARLRLALALVEDELPGPPPPSLQAAAQEVDELGALVEDLLLSARLRGGAPLDAAPVDLRRLLAPLAARAGAALVEGPPITVRGDARLLRRAVDNLLQNAARHGAPPVRLGWTAAAGAARLFVEDAGPGVPEAERARVFEPFHRASPGTPGVGLGLSIVDEIACQHGGSARCEAAAGGGARFVVELPLG